MTLTFGSACSGIEAASCAWKPLGWRPAFVAEVDPAPARVLMHRHDATRPLFPRRVEDAADARDAKMVAQWVKQISRMPDGGTLPNYGDMSRFLEWPDHAIDVFVAGTPCQDFSVAGLRAGLDGPRGALMLKFGGVAARYRPRWLLWENVPGVLSINEGRDFGSLLGLLSGQHVEAPKGGWQNSGVIPQGSKHAYGLAYRVLDAQYFGVPQRRRRVFVVGSLGDWRPAAAVLFERHSLSGNPPPRGKTRQVTAGAVDASAGGSDENDAEQNRLVAQAAHTPNAKGGVGRIDAESETFIAHTLKAEGFDASEDGTGRGTPIVPVCYPLQADSFTRSGDAVTSAKAPGAGIGEDGAPSFTLDASKPHGVAYPIQAGALRDNPDAGPQGVGVQDDLAYTMEARREVQMVCYQTSGNAGAWETGDVSGALDTNTDPASHVICFSSKDHGQDACVELAPTLRASGHDESWENGGAPPAVAINLRGREGGSAPELDALASLRAADGGSSRSYVATSTVRRLTPRECERLQGFADDYTLVPIAATKRKDVLAALSHTPPRYDFNARQAGQRAPLSIDRRRRLAARGRWPSLQAARQLDGRSGHALDRRADRHGGNGTRKDSGMITWRNTYRSKRAAQGAGDETQ